MPYGNPYKRTTSQSVRDYEQVIVRTNCLGRKVELVTDYLKGLYDHKVTAVSLLSYATSLEQQLGIQIDRLARRNRQALFCWFTENWDIIQPVLTRTSTKNTSKENGINLLDISQLLNYH